MSESVTIRVSTGELAGSRAGGVDRYLGVPYAAPPVGERRFAEAAPVAPWKGARDATRMGPTAPQNPMGPASGRYLPNVIDPGDDYLNVNVWAPAEATGRPVMVWFHGGSLKHGSNAVAGYDGTAFARDGIVLVSVNYRLGVEGFSVLDDAPLNLGYSDMVAALRWVQREIAVFGGDPGAVTIFGESAGGVAVGDLLVSGHAGELFHRAILQSGMPAASPRKKSARLTRAQAKALGIPPTRAAFAAVPVERLLQTEIEVMQGSGSRVSGGYVGTIGGPVVPASPVDAALSGAGDEIPVMVGWTKDEHTFFLLGGGFDRIGPVLFALIRLRSGAGRRVMRAYREAYPGATRAVLTAVMTVDRILRIPMHRIAQARRRRGAPTWFYEFDWETPIDGLGATHALEIGFVFDTLDSPGWRPLTGAEPPQRLADEMHAAWVRFASTGEPGWRAWDDARPTMVFGETPARVIDGPRDAQLEAWRKREGDAR